jgi:hypothetical protein
VIGYTVVQGKKYIQVTKTQEWRIFTRFEGQCVLSLPISFLITTLRFYESAGQNHLRKSKVKEGEVDLINFHFPILWLKGKSAEHYHNPLLINNV